MKGKERRQRRRLHSLSSQKRRTMPLIRSSLCISLLDTLQTNTLPALLVSFSTSSHDASLARSPFFSVTVVVAVPAGINVLTPAAHPSK